MSPQPTAMKRRKKVRTTETGIRRLTQGELVDVCIRAGDDLLNQEAARNTLNLNTKAVSDGGHGLHQ